MINDSFLLFKKIIHDYSAVADFIYRLYFTFLDSNCDLEIAVPQDYFCTIQRYLKK